MNAGKMVSIAVVAMVMLADKIQGADAQFLSVKATWSDRELYPIDVGQDKSGGSYLLLDWSGTVRLSDKEVKAVGIEQTLLVKYDSKDIVRWLYTPQSSKWSRGIRTIQYENSVFCVANFNGDIHDAHGAVLSSAEADILPFVGKFDSATGNTNWIVLLNRESVSNAWALDAAIGKSDVTDVLYLLNVENRSAPVKQTVQVSVIEAGSGQLLRSFPIPSSIAVANPSGITVSLASSKEDGCCLLGRIERNITFEGTALSASAAAPKLILIKYRSNGTVEWFRIAESDGGVYPAAVASDGSTGFYVAGVASGSEAFRFGNREIKKRWTHSTFVVRVSSDGTVDDQAILIEPVPSKYGNAIGVSDDGSVAVSGVGNGQMEFGNTTVTLEQDLFESYIARFSQSKALDFVKIPNRMEGSFFLANKLSAGRRGEVVFTDTFAKRVRLDAFDHVLPKGEAAGVYVTKIGKPVEQTPLLIIQEQPEEPAYTNGPVKLDGKDMLLVATHGWLSRFLHPVVLPEVRWLSDIELSIKNYLVEKGASHNWQTHMHDWREKSWVVYPGDAIDAGIAEGKELGRVLSSQKWKHVHFIAHSAGAALIQSATEVIKNSKDSQETTVHTTFLDAFVGFDYAGKTNYGKWSDWSDNYYCHDFLTSGGIYPFTESALAHSYNVDVTWLDPTKDKRRIFTSEAPNGTPCEETVSSHDWPYKWYIQTITGKDTSGFGFPLSREAGTWEEVKNQRGTNNTPVLLGTPDRPCVESFYVTTPSVIGPVLDFSQGSVTTSILGLDVDALQGEIRLTTHSPAWLSKSVEVADRANFVVFKSSFVGSEAQGLLSVYWDAVRVGSVDQQVVGLGFNRHTFQLPETERGTHTIGFRLDTFTAVQASVAVRNVALGFRGVQEPFSLSCIGFDAGNLPLLLLTGPKGFAYAIESSQDLEHWESVALLMNTTGTVRCTDDQPRRNESPRFYRALAP